jgi:hypothetical protein
VAREIRKMCVYVCICVCMRYFCRTHWYVSFGVFLYLGKVLGLHILSRDNDNDIYYAFARFN